MRNVLWTGAVVLGLVMCAAMAGCLGHVQKNRKTSYTKSHQRLTTPSLNNPFLIKGSPLTSTTGHFQRVEVKCDDPKLDAVQNREVILPWYQWEDGSYDVLFIKVLFEEEVPDGENVKKWITIEEVEHEETGYQKPVWQHPCQVYGRTSQAGIGVNRKWVRKVRWTVVKY